MTRARAGYVARPRHPVTGRQIRLRAPTRAGLDKLLAHVAMLRAGLELGAQSEAEVSSQLARLLRRGQPSTVAALARDYQDRGDLSAHTRRRVSSFLEGQARPIAALEVEALTSQTVGRWLSSLHRDHAPATVSLAWRTLRSLVRHAAEQGWVTRAPWGPWRPTIRAQGGGRAPARLPREACRTRAELAQLLAGADQVDPTGRLGCQIAIAAGLGLRDSELGALTWNDWDEIRGELAIGPKGGGRVVVPVPDDVAERIKEWRPVDSVPFWPIFPGGAARAVRGECLTRAQLRRAVEIAGLPNPRRWSAHSMKDTFATIAALETGGDLAELARRTRHASVGSLVRYLRTRERSGAPPLLPSSSK